ncbi:MAG: serine protease, partial [Maritimibacter sp.]|nr:serine protease [Maritimibacter sp.]
MTTLTRSLVLVFLLASGAGAQTSDETTARVPASSAEMTLSFAPVVAAAAPAVVNIYATLMVADGGTPLFDDPFFRQFFGDFGRSQPREQNALGSGVIVGGGLVV